MDQVPRQGDLLAALVVRSFHLGSFGACGHRGGSGPPPTLGSYLPRRGSQGHLGPVFLLRARTAPSANLAGAWRSVCSSSCSGSTASLSDPGMSASAARSSCSLPVCPTASGRPELLGGRRTVRRISYRTEPTCRLVPASLTAPLVVVTLPVSSPTSRSHPFAIRLCGAHRLRTGFDP